MIPVCYVSSGYSEEKASIEMTQFWAEELWSAGFATVTPLLNTRRLHISDEVRLRGNLRLIELCDTVYMCPNWRTSDEAKRERRVATSRGKPIFYSLGEAIAWLRKNGVVLQKGGETAEQLGLFKG